MNGQKVILISIDGMRPDGFLQCGNPFVEELMSKTYYTLNGQTVFPSVTLPCHMSLFHSVPPTRHGISTNFYMPMVRPLNGIFEELASHKAISAMYYGWEPMKDVSRPNSLKYAEYINARQVEYGDQNLTDSALARIEKSKPDFIFLYMVETDEKGGHDNGWMSDAYLKQISIALDNVKRVFDACGDEYTIIITADHGGHDRIHGTDLPEDMTIPMFYYGKDFEKGKRFDGGSILDITPTIAKVMGIAPAEEWEGKPIF